MAGCIDGVGGCLCNLVSLSLRLLSSSCLLVIISNKSIWKNIFFWFSWTWHTRDFHVTHITWLSQLQALLLSLLLYGNMETLTQSRRLKLQHHSFIHCLQHTISIITIYTYSRTLTLPHNENTSQNTRYLPLPQTRRPCATGSCLLPKTLHQQLQPDPLHPLQSKYIHFHNYTSPSQSPSPAAALPSSLGPPCPQQFYARRQSWP